MAMIVRKDLFLILRNIVQRINLQESYINIIILNFSMENNIKVEFINGENDYKHYIPNQTDLVKIQSQNPQLKRQSSSENNKVVIKGLSKQTRKKQEAQFREGLQIFCQKYFLQLTPQQFDDVVQKGMAIKDIDARNGMYIEFVAAVVYCIYSDYLGLTNTKQFCRCKGLRPRAFHQKYKQLKINISSNDSSSQEGKYQTKIQEQSTPVELKQLTGKKTFRINPEDMTTVEAIDVIFDTFFKSQYYQLRRREIIEKVAEKYQSTSPAILEAMDWTNNKSLKLYYTVLYYLRQCGANIVFGVLKELLNDKLGLKIRKEQYFETVRLFKKIDKEQEINISSNVNIIPADRLEVKEQMNY